MLVVLLALGCVLAVGVAGAAAEDPDDEEIIEIQTVTAGETQGEIALEISYHIGDEVAGLEVGLADPEFDVIGTDGFSPADDEEDTYEWDEQTTAPTVTVRAEINRSNPRFEGYDFVDAGEWLLTDRLAPMDVRWRAVDPERIDLHRTVEVGQEGVAGDRMVYLGPYDTAQFSTDDEQFRVVVADSAGPAWAGDAIGERLQHAAEQLDVGAYSERLTLFAVTDPLRRGGVASSSNADIWIHDAALAEPQTVLHHEYVHSRQAYDRTAAVEWTIEGGADYYAFLLALKDGTIEYHQFHDRLDRGNVHDDVVLTDPATWQGTQADYERGALVIAHLDSELRNRGGSFEGVFRAKNSYELTVDDSEFEAFVSDAAGTDMSDFFEEHIRSSSLELPVPAPTVYDAPRSDGSLRLDSSELDLEPGQSEILDVEITNEGPGQSLAPMLSLNSPDGTTVEFFDSDSSRVTETTRGWVLDHLDPGETHTVQFLVEAHEGTGQLDFAVEDLGGERASTAVSVDARQPLEVSLEVPETAEEGEMVELRVNTSLEPSEIDEYRFEITGPTANLTQNTTEPELVFEAAESGIYDLFVTVTAVDNRTATASGRLTVEQPAADDADADTDHGETDGETDDDATGTDEQAAAADADDDLIADDPNVDDSGDGFGPVVAVGALLLAALLVRLAPRNRQ